VLWQAFTAEEPVVLLIDEIDKADIEFPNDLLRELDRMEFYVYETRELVAAKHRPLVIITSNNEKELPDAFLRRCFFHYIKFPDPTPCSRSSTCTSRTQARAAGAGAGRVLRGARGAGPEEEALDLGTDRLAQAADGRGHPPEALHSQDNKAAYRRCMARCSRTSRMCTCSSAWSSCHGITADATRPPCAPIAPVTLELHGVRLEPPARQCGRPACRCQRRRAVEARHLRAGTDQVDAYIAKALGQRPERLAFAVLDAASGKVLGTTSYHDIVPAIARLEIGYTWWRSAPAHHVNTTAS
jgi:hypothetical protein